MAPITGPVAARSEYTSPLEAPLYAAIIPVAVFVLLGACVAIRRLVHRREEAHGQQALESWPWSWLAACVGSRPLTKPTYPYGDDWDTASPPTHMSSVGSCPSPIGSKASMVRQSRKQRPAHMWEYVGRLDVDPVGEDTLSKKASIMTLGRDDDDNDDEQPPNGDRRPSKPFPITPKPAAATASKTSEATDVVAEGSKAQASRQKEQQEEGLDDDGEDAETGSPTKRKDSTYTNKRKGRLLTQPPMLHLPSGIGRGDSHWELDMRK